MNIKHFLLTCLFGALMILGSSLTAQITLPPSGGNQKAEVSQYMGLVKVTFIYNSPDVTASNGSDRKGQIWGKLVPYGLSPNNFGSASEIPWRAGANENTIFRTSHDILIEGKKLPAGEYGFHVIPEEGKNKWTLIFSSQTGAWGSYYYDSEEDVLRVETSPEETEYHEWLTYEFDERNLSSCTAALLWENLRLPFKIEVPNIHDLYIANLESELTGNKGFTWQNWNSAAQYCLQYDTHLSKGLQWAENAVSAPFIGQANFTTLNTKAQLLKKMGKEDEAADAMDQAIAHPTASVFQIHQYGRQLISQGEADKALEIFIMNAERNPDTWPVNVGLARGYSATGNQKKALKHAKLALENVPQGDQLNENSVKKMISMLENGETIN